ncbi:MAG: hypothetical protein QOJ04_4995, partial [Caballeronia sp.]|nr:hypothetical protein [Caballeronia sp.]
IIKLGEKQPLTDDDLYCGVLDYYEDWRRESEKDPRFAQHHEHLAPYSWAFGNDLVNMATYVATILFWQRPDQLHSGYSCITTSAMVEAFLFSARAACDLLGTMLAYKAAKPKQAPKSLFDLIAWAKEHPERVQPEIRELLSGDFEWFYKLRNLRDSLSHGVAFANIYHSDRQFYLWMIHVDGHEGRQPLLPILATQLTGILSLANRSAAIINKLIDFPEDKVKSKVVHGLLVPQLHELVRIAPDYAVPID